MPAAFPRYGSFHAALLFEIESTTMVRSLIDSFTHIGCPDLPGASNPHSGLRLATVRIEEKL